MPCMNFSEDRESGERTTFSLTKWISSPKFVDGHPVLEVAVQPVRLFDQNGTAGVVLLEEGDHLAETGAAGCLAVSTSTNSCSTVYPFAPA